MLLEKAYAKLQGSYENTIGVDLVYALKDLAGGFIHTVNLSPELNSSLQNETSRGQDGAIAASAGTIVDDHFSRMWEFVNEAFRTGHLLSAIRDLPRASDVQGIETARPYVVVDTFQALPQGKGLPDSSTLLKPVQLIRLKNAWGHKRWVGCVPPFGTWP